MLLEELLQRDGPQKRPQNLPSDGEVQNRGSLLQQVRALSGFSETADVPTAEDHDGGAAEGIRLPDGYIRRSPVQTYRTPEDYTRRRVRKAVLALVGLAVVALLVLAILKMGLFKLR